MNLDETKPMCIPATMRDGGMLNDGTRKIYIYTQEVEPEQLFSILKESGKLGWFFFHQSPISQIDTKSLPEINLEKNEKSKAQRLRSVLYRLWEQGSKSITSEEFYNVEMEKIIDSIKDKLT